MLLFVGRFNNNIHRAGLVVRVGGGKEGKIGSEESGDTRRVGVEGRF